MNAPPGYQSGYATPTTYYQPGYAPTTTYIAPAPTTTVIR